MFDKRVVEARLKKLDDCAAELRELSRVRLNAYLEDSRLQAVVERYFQVAIQACMDMASYIVARNRLQIPEKGRIYSSSWPGPVLFQRRWPTASKAWPDSGTS